jgi:hypothetical protein
VDPVIVVEDLDSQRSCMHLHVAYC